MHNMYKSIVKIKQLWTTSKVKEMIYIYIYIYIYGNDVYKRIKGCDGFSY